ncbi:MAG: hypothetical protein KME10_16985 [Plectolyngbya sp. WJT66-NPBG17]|nr:hypothetical protein [Plectolyngbya sp. WJT66-NPBG17]MBW4525979.1 hypothetical protein [Phormidium tanganyikae FI6-MK23]
MTLTISRHPKPSCSHRQQCAGLPRLWMLTALVELSGQLSIQDDRRFESYGSEDEKFNLDNIKSGWCLRLTPM